MLTKLLLAAALAAASPESASPEAAAQFEPPVRLMAGDKYVGTTRMYPSPCMFDLDGDKKADLVIGDLFGHLSVYSPYGDAWKAKPAIKGANGKKLDFSNW